MFTRTVNLEILTLQKFHQDTLIASNLPAQTADSKPIVLIVMLFGFTEVLLDSILT